MNQQHSSSIHLQVELGERSYPIEIGLSLLSNPDIVSKHITGKRVAVVTNTIVAPLYLKLLTRSLEAAGKQVFAIVLPDGEQEKTGQA